MRFTTFSFFLFFAIIYLFYWKVKTKQKLVLLFYASLLFYAAWSPWFMLHFLIMISINYWFISQEYSNSKKILPVIITLNLVNLFLFKYFYFLLHILSETTNLNIFSQEEFNKLLFHHTGFSHIVLPLAISFYTFQMIAFHIDIKRKLITDKPSFLKFAVFILFFPQLVAGPIVRYSEFFYQLEKIFPDEKKIRNGSYLIILGLIKKVLIADNISPFVTSVYLHPEEFNWYTNLFAVIGYSVQLYNDFSGYTDIARGLGKMMGLELPENFNGPYLAKSVSELWHRWHITLSSWLRDYIYIPLGGSKTTLSKSSFNVVITFVIGGIWHGANYTFLLWGFIHGAIITLERFFIQKKNQSFLFPKSMLRIFYSYTIFTLSLIPFNSPDISTAIQMMMQMITGGSGNNHSQMKLVLWLLPITFVLNYIQYNNKQEEFFNKYNWRGLMIAGLIFLILAGRFAPNGNSFIYFQF